jgi:lipopolysaccharide export system ATP-binding protein
MLKVQNLSQTLQKRKILHSISLSIKKGEVTAFLGPNGAGKTTLLKTIVGLLPSRRHSESENRICLEGVVINDWSTGKRVTNGLVYLPQQSALFQQLTVLDNLALVYHYNTFWKSKTWSEFSESVDSWLKKTGLTCPLKQKAATLSGGQKRKLEVIRTILMRPKVAMFDEPFAGVDPKSIYELKEIFNTMTEKHSIAVIISDHNVDQLLSIARSIYVVIDGKIVTYGGIKDILGDRETKNAYFGNQFYTEVSERFL